MENTDIAIATIFISFILWTIFLGLFTCNDSPLYEPKIGFVLGLFWPITIPLLLLAGLIKTIKFCCMSIYNSVVE
jgi:hypothetical protein